jgi:ADP-ribose pyrophosphatase YjhB (NUDIX family)
VIDHFDRIRSLFAAVNGDDEPAILSLYHGEAIAERLLFDDAGSDRAEGRDAIARAWHLYLTQYSGGLPGGRRFEVRTIAGIETGWGWVQAEWIESAVDRASGARETFAGYSHFLIEDGEIRRQRNVRERLTGDPGSVDPPERHPRAYPSRPMVGVGAVLLIDGKIVLVKRRHEPLAGQWSLPGGALELGETLEAGVAREMLEETGLVVDVGPVIEVFDRILLDEQRKVRYHFVLVDYLCRRIGGTLASASDAVDVALVDPSGLDRYHLAPKALDVIARALGLAREDA